MRSFHALSFMLKCQRVFFVQVTLEMQTECLDLNQPRIFLIIKNTQVELFDSLSTYPVNICITFMQCWANVDNAGPTLYKCYTNVLCQLDTAIHLLNFSEILSRFIFHILHLRLCKSFLVVHAKASNDAVRGGELGRRPIIFFILKSAIKHWVRLQTSDDEIHYFTKHSEKVQHNTTNAVD